MAAKVSNKNCMFICSSYFFVLQEICLAAYRGVVQPDSEDKRIISAQWATDEDISRLLKSLPNWQLAVSDTLSIIEGGGENAAVSTESPQEVEQRNAQVTILQLFDPV